MLLGTNCIALLQYIFTGFRLYLDYAAGEDPGKQPGLRYRSRPPGHPGRLPRFLPGLLPSGRQVKTPAGDPRARIPGKTIRLTASIETSWTPGRLP